MTEPHSPYELYAMARGPSLVDWLRFSVGILARIIVWASAALIVADAAVVLIRRNDVVEAIASVVFFPFTVFVWPWVHHAWSFPLWIAGLGVLVGYPISTFIGGLPPIERPGDL